MASVSSQQNASMELIPGMDKLLNHMKEQDKKIKELKEHIDKLEEGNKKRFDKIKGLEYELKQEKEKKPDKPIVIKDSDIKRANKNLSKQLETEKDKVNQALTALECWKEENKKLKEGQIKLDRDLVDMVWDPLMKDGFIIRYPFAPITDHLKILVDDYKKVKEENKKLQEENKKLKEWSLSTQMIEDTSAETIEEFERDVRDNWKENTEFTEEIDELKEKITCLESDSHNEVSQAEHEEQIEEYIQTEKVFDENDEKMKTELVMMYSIIMNDGVKNEIPFLNCADTITILKSNITLMLEKFKTMGEKYDKLKKEHIQNIMKTKSIATELYREMKYALGYGEFDEPDRKVMYEEIKKLKEALEELQEMSRDKVRELIKEYFHGELVGSRPCPTSYCIYDWHSEEEEEEEE